MSKTQVTIERRQFLIGGKATYQGREWHGCAVEGYRRNPMPLLFNEDDHFGFDQPRNNFAAAVESYASWGYFDGGASSGGGIARGNYADGYQIVPVNWGVNTPTKRGFFQLLQEITGF